MEYIEEGKQLNLDIAYLTAFVTQQTQAMPTPTMTEKPAAAAEAEVFGTVPASTFGGLRHGFLNPSSRAATPQHPLTAPGDSENAPTELKPRK